MGSDPLFLKKNWGHIHLICAKKNHGGYPSKMLAEIMEIWDSLLNILKYLEIAVEICWRSWPFMAS